MMNTGEIETAWLAGLYEGEGSLVRGKERGWALSVTMCDEDVIRRAHEMTGVGTVTHINKPNGWTDQWRWRVLRRDDIAAVVDAIRAHLGGRRGAKADEFTGWYVVQPAVAATARKSGIPGQCVNGHAKIAAGSCKACAAARQRKHRDRHTA